MKGSAFLALAAALLPGAALIDAQQQLTLHFQDTRVTLNAQNVPVRQILAEWARIGGAQIVNGDKVLGPAVTLQLIDLPERQALDIVLRSVSGYLLAMRQPGTPGASAFDRIVILPTSAAPRNPPPVNPGPAPVSRPTPRQLVQPPVYDPDGDPDDQSTDDPSEPSAGVPPQVAVPPQPSQPARPPRTAPGNPFGLPLGSGAPGAVTPVPQADPRTLPRSSTMPPPSEGQGQTSDGDGAR